MLPRALGLPRDAVRAAEQLVAGQHPENLAGPGQRTSFRVLRRHRHRRRGDSPPRARAAARRTERAPAMSVFAWELTRLLAERRGRFEPALEILGRGRAAFALVANGNPYTYAGPIPIRIAPEARFELGHRPGRPARRLAGLRLPRLLAYALLGRGQSTAGDIVYGHDLDRIEIVCDRPDADPGRRRGPRRLDLRDFRGGARRPRSFWYSPARTMPVQTKTTTLTTTECAVLGLLARAPRSGLRPQEGGRYRSVGYFWAPAKSQIYAVLPSLVEAGYATSRKVAQQRRPDKQVYRITAAGRAALSEWIEEAPDSPSRTATRSCSRSSSATTPPRSSCSSTSARAASRMEQLKDELDALDARARGDPRTTSSRS